MGCEARRSHGRAPGRSPGVEPGRAMHGGEPTDVGTIGRWVLCRHRVGEDFVARRVNGAGEYQDQVTHTEGQSQRTVSKASPHRGPDHHRHRTPPDRTVQRQQAELRIFVWQPQKNRRLGREIRAKTHYLCSNRPRAQAHNGSCLEHVHERGGSDVRIDRDGGDWNRRNELHLTFPRKVSIVLDRLAP